MRERIPMLPLNNYIILGSLTCFCCEWQLVSSTTCSLVVIGKGHHDLSSLEILICGDWFYFACFAEIKSDCNHRNCYNGWIPYYISEDTGCVEGYPGNTQIPSVFRLNINSPADFEIRKSPNLSQYFDTIIDIACSQFDPTVTSSSKSTFQSEV